MGEGGWGWGTGEMGVGLDLESADRVGVWGCVCPSLRRVWEAPFISPEARAEGGLQRPSLPLSRGEAQLGQCDLPGPRPGWRGTWRAGLGSLALLFLSRLPSCGPGGTLMWGP